MNSTRTVTINSGNTVTAVEVSGKTQQYSSASYTLTLNGDPDIHPAPIEELASEMQKFTSRILGRANDLDGAFDNTAQQFSEVIKWSIQNFSAEDLALWSDVSSNMSFCASILENWKDAVQTYKDERLRIINRWNDEAPGLAEDLDTAPPRIQFILSDSPAEAAEKALEALKEELESDESTAYKLFKDTGEQLSDDLKSGPTTEAVGRLMEGGYVTWSQFNLGGSSANMPDDVDPTRLADNIIPYVNGDRELDDDYYEMLAVLTAIGWRAERANSNEDENMDPEDMVFLKEFYDQLESNIPIADLARLSSQSEFMGKEDAAPLLAALGTGILVLSDQRLKNGDDSVPGGYADLPLSVREAAEGDPDFGMMDHHWEALGNLFRHVPEGVEGGRGLSLTLGLTVGDALVDPLEIPSATNLEHMEAVLGVATRNFDANADMISGPGNWYEHPRLGSEMHEEEKRHAALEAIFTQEWTDDGAAASGYTDWILDARQAAGEETQAVDEVAKDLLKFLTDEERYNRMTDLTGGVYSGEQGEFFRQSGLSFTQVNHEMANGLVNIFGAYVDEFATAAGNEKENGSVYFSEEDGSLRIHDSARNRFLEYIAGGPEAAASMTAISELHAHQGMIEVMEGDKYASVLGDERSRLTRAINEALITEASSRVDGEFEALLSAHEKKIAGRELFVDLLFKPADLIETNNAVGNLLVGEIVNGLKSAATDIATSDVELQLPPPPKPTASFDDSILGNTISAGSAILDHQVQDGKINPQDLKGFDYLEIENGQLKVNVSDENEAIVMAEIREALQGVDGGSGEEILDEYLDGFHIGRTDELGSSEPELSEENQKKADENEAGS